MQTQVDLKEVAINQFPLSPISIICEEDSQETRFDNLLKLWIDDKISFQQLMENYPDFNASMISKILKKLVSIIHIK